MFDNNKVSNNALTKLIQELRSFLTKAEVENFYLVWIEAMSAINQFKENTETANLFVAPQSSYTRDKICDLDFTQIGFVISQINNTKTKTERLQQYLDELPNTTTHLKDQINILLNGDPDNARKEIYKKALDYIDKIESFVRGTPEHGLTSMRRPPN